LGKGRKDVDISSVEAFEIVECIANMKQKHSKHDRSRLALGIVPRHQIS
jgi:hypothetical protein